MSLDSRLRLARRESRGAVLKHFEVPAVCEALQLLRACERAEAAAKAHQPSPEIADSETSKGRGDSPPAPVVGTVAERAAALVQKHAARLGMDSFAADTLVRAVLQLEP